MDSNVILQMIGQYAFPVVACCAMGYYVKYSTDENNKRLDNLNAQHKEEMSQVTQALNNNTLALQHLADMMSHNNNDLK